MVEPAQIRAARALLDWRQMHLAVAAKISLRTVVRFENGDDVIALVPDALQHSLEREGVEFIPGGVRLREMGEAAE